MEFKVRSYLIRFVLIHSRSITRSISPLLPMTIFQEACIKYNEMKINRLTPIDTNVAILGNSQRLVDAAAVHIVEITKGASARSLGAVRRW